MLDKLFSDPLFILLLTAFFLQLAILLFSSRIKKKRGLEWLAKEHQQTHRTQHEWLKPVKHAVRVAFSASEDEMKRKFLSSGYYNNRFAIYYMPFKYLLLITGCVVLYWISGLLNWTTSDTIIYCLLWVVAALILPDAYLAAKARRLKVRVTHKLPYMIDLLAVCVQTGMTIEASMNYLSKEMKDFDPDLGYLLNKTRERTKVVGLEKALDDLYERVPTNEMRSFVMTLKQSIQYGSSVYEVLTNLSSEIRAVQMLNVEEKIGKLAAKMSVPLILFIMFPIVVLIAAPGIMRMMN
ncbi:type II secretion system F family protein [Marinomonas atlantica]|uniref:type II secretion system F family protein n=1 Tax=Marinomonas atlantica TaxID=1806668 RepID=UPI0009EEC08F|nr:type II secretion system F family protein [Marinomonas atlantica]